MKQQKPQQRGSCSDAHLVVRDVALSVVVFALLVVAVPPTESGDKL